MKVAETENVLENMLGTPRKQRRTERMLNRYNNTGDHTYNKAKHRIRILMALSQADKYPKEIL